MSKKTVLACSVCGSRNYKTSNTSDSRNERLELKKFCSTCKVHTIHRQA